MAGAKMTRSELKEEVKRIKKERKELRKTLRAKGIKSKHDFETIAHELGLVYPPETTRGFILPLFLKWGAWWRVLVASTGLYNLLFAGIALLSAFLIYAFISEQRGHFTINMTADMMEEGFILSEDGDFTRERYRLYTDPIRNVNATSIYTINRGVHEVDGSHNGPGYLAYTFYLKNNGELTINYAYTVNITSQTMNADQAVWLMFFEDEKQVVYSRMSADGNPEELYGYLTAPFIETALIPEQQYYIENEKAGIITTPYIDEHTALQGLVTDFEPGEVKKYTVVIWCEGDDPECTDDIMGGHVGFSVQFDRLSDEGEGFFKGLYRKEYELSQSGIQLEDK